MVHEFQSIAKKLLADFERSSNLQHQGIKGVARERALVIQLLKDHLPGKYSIGSGLILDSSGTASKQQDIVIYDGFSMPVLQNFEESKVFFAEQVYATIEVKSNLGREEVKDVVEKAGSIKQLRWGSTTEPSIFVFGFAFRSSLTFEQIRDFVQKRVNKSDKGWGIGAIAVLDDKDGRTGLITNVDPYLLGSIKVKSVRQDPIASIITKNKGDTLLVFYLLLMEALRLASSLITPPNYLSYANSAGLGTIDVFVGKPGTELMANQKALEVLRQAHQLTDDEVIRAWHFLIRHAEIASNEIIIHPNAVFILGGLVLTDVPRPIEIMEATERYLAGNATGMDINKLAYLVDILRKVSSENIFIEIGSSIY